LICPGCSLQGRARDGPQRGVGWVNPAPEPSPLSCDLPTLQKQNSLRYNGTGTLDTSIMISRFAAQGANGEAGAEGSPLQRAAPVTWTATLRGLRCAEGDCSISTAGVCPRHTCPRDGGPDRQRAGAGRRRLVRRSHAKAEVVKRAGPTPRRASAEIVTKREAGLARAVPQFISRL